MQKIIPTLVELLIAFSFFMDILSYLNPKIASNLVSTISSYNFSWAGQTKKREPL